MRCTHCDTRMEQTGCVTEHRVRQTWHQCPVCSATQTVSQPYESTLRRVGNSLRCSGCWPQPQRMFGS